MAFTTLRISYTVSDDNDFNTVYERTFSDEVPGFSQKQIEDFLQIFAEGTCYRDELDGAVPVSVFEGGDRT